MQTHPASETRNPDVDMQTMAPVPKLDDPGIGLRNNGREVLRYSQLHSLHAPADDHEPSREIELHLTGNMERFTWGFDGIAFSDAAPIRLKYGERVRMVLINDTMMAVSYTHLDVYKRQVGIGCSSKTNLGAFLSLIHI